MIAADYVMSLMLVATGFQNQRAKYVMHLRVISAVLKVLCHGKNIIFIQLNHVS